MSTIIGRTAFRATQALRATGINPGAESAASAASRKADKSSLSQGAKRDPELYVLLGIMTSIFAVAGIHFSRKPTSSSSEAQVAMAPNSQPWHSGTSGKYQYHPGGDPNNAPKDAPSALHSVVVPNVNLPRELHERYNKWGKEGY